MKIQFLEHFIQEYSIRSYSRREILNNILLKIINDDTDIEIIKCPTDALHVYVKNNNDTCRIYYKYRDSEESVIVYHFEFK